MNYSIITRAPVRICDIGGWTDTWYYPSGAVFNICVDLYSYVRIIENGLNKVRIIAENLEKTTEIMDISSIEYNGDLDLLKAAIKRMGICEGLDILIRADAPPGCGTGTSASIAVSLLSALAKYSNRDMTRNEIAQLAHKLETEELKLESGIQDQYAAAYGGINFMEIDYPRAILSKIEISSKIRFELESQIILVYLSSRSSSEMHKAVIENFIQGDEKTLHSFEVMKNCAYEMRDVISSGIEDIGAIINKNWEAQKNLHSLMTNESIKTVESIAKANGAVGFKCNGAGGGGSATILAGWGNEFKLRKVLHREGFTILPCKLSPEGVTSFVLD